MSGGRASKWRPWRFSLRSLLLLTAVIAVGAAFFGWRERQLPQRRAVARIVELGGSVEIERRGWFEAITRGCDTEEVVSVTLPGTSRPVESEPVSMSCMFGWLPTPLTSSPFSLSAVGLRMLLRS